MSTLEALPKHIQVEENIVLPSQAGIHGQKHQGPEGVRRTADIDNWRERRRRAGGGVRERERRKEGERERGAHTNEHTRHCKGGNSEFVVFKWHQLLAQSGPWQETANDGRRRCAESGGRERWEEGTEGGGPRAQEESENGQGKKEPESSCGSNRRNWRRKNVVMQSENRRKKSRAPSRGPSSARTRPLPRLTQEKSAAGRSRGDWRKGVGVGERVGMQTRRRRVVREGTRNPEVGKSCWGRL